MSEALTTETALEDKVATEAAPNPSQDRPRSLWSDAWRDLRRNPVFVVSGLLILLLLVIAAVPSLFTSVDPKFADLAHHYLKPPNYSHIGQADWFGYDGQGRSVYSRVLYGARASIIVGVCTTFGVAVLGALVGMFAGYYGGWLDSLLSRLTDVFFGVPLLLGAIVILNAFTHRTVWSVVVAMVLLGWTQIARVMRGSVITVKQQDFVQAARALGAGTGRILFRHILPNAVAPVIVVSTIALGGYIATEATLSYLGIGLPPSAVSWGNDISSGQTVIRTAPHVLFFPSAMLSITVLAFIMLGDAVRDALDPKLR
ncbi:ABC transporter permease [Streptomyces sp. J2-1]|uniref:ABC transporter permease n=1 Tax=Streptomyces corallincola TaxID=2851888 RepID=UPI001C38B2B3|nr:ABC transporter permease [Streptomyces corallincola]MBV2353073.1 ABC transporter permease [Streptomyces corallincola]